MAPLVTSVTSRRRRSGRPSLLGELHRTTPKVPGPPVHDPTVAGRPVLEAALGELSTRWHGGPYAEPAREAIAARGPRIVGDVLAHYDQLCERVRGAEPVLTHGEPHPGNVPRGDGGRLLLIDWDTVAPAPPERDLWMIAGGSGAEFETYTAVTGRRPDPAALDLYRLRWDLDDLTIYLRTFRSPHERGPDTDLAWSGFTGSLDRAVAALP
ncbi:phosphotransferase [Streptomyces sp. Je 1-332]|uniref:phosphotransferase family protein n=1 Tax=Streptomyces sp. Je 1-332 TaxID=3231270 RepID=UPI003459E37B